MKLKSQTKNITVEGTVQDIMNMEAYVLIDGELVSTNRPMKNMIAQSIWARLKKKIPDKLNNYPLLAVSMKIDTDGGFSMVFWEHAPDEENLKYILE